MDVIAAPIALAQLITAVNDMLVGGLDWLTEHATIVMIASVLTTIGIERVVRRLASRPEDAASSRTSIASGLAYLAAKGVGSKVAFFALAMWIYDHHAIFELDPRSPMVWLALFLGRDFVYYWVHRAEHSVNALWASHMIHHSATHFSFTTAVRMPWMEALYKPIIALWIPLVGFHPVASAAIGAVVLAVGQFHHTELGRRRTVLDTVFVTPSAHRVHHGSNELYLDKNFGSMLIVWDRLFGTYQAETETVTYGLTGNKTIDSARGALVGGYRELVAGMRDRTPAGAMRFALGRPS